MARKLVIKADMVRTVPKGDYDMKRHRVTISRHGVPIARLTVECDHENPAVYLRQGHFSAFDDNDLRDAFSADMGRVVGCHIEIDGKTPPGCKWHSFDVREIRHIGGVFPNIWALCG